MLFDFVSRPEPLPYLTAVRNYHILGNDELWWGSYSKYCVEMGQDPPPHPKLRSIPR